MIKKFDSVFVLDTHIWIWLMNGEKNKISPKMLKIFNEKEGFLFKISAISIWEVGMLEAKGRIVLPFSCLEWVQRAFKAPGISMADLTPEIALESSRLPGNFHGDPADRIIVATARSLGATLMTKDKDILSYGKKKHVRVV